MIRLATSADAAAIAAIWEPVVRHSLVTFSSTVKSDNDVCDLLQAAEARGHATFVADNDGIAGFATYGQFRTGAGYAHTMEHTIILAPEARGQGLGRELMVAVMDHARSQGAHSMFSGISAANPAGVNFHRALGFQQIARFPQVGRKFDQWLDLIFMQKWL